jgi:hypothetical protein
MLQTNFQHKRSEGTSSEYFVLLLKLHSRVWAQQLWYMNENAAVLHFVMTQRLDAASGTKLII